MRYRLLAITALALVHAGCRSPAGGDGLTAVTSLSPRSFRPGDVAEIRVTVTNHGFVARTIHASACGATLVTTETGADAGFIDADCDGSLNPLTLRFGEQTVLTRPWRGETRGGEFFSVSRPLPPGRYRLQSRIGLLEGGSLIDGGVVVGRPITITLTP